MFDELVDWTDEAKSPVELQRLELERLDTVRTGVLVWEMLLLGSASLEKNYFIQSTTSAVLFWLTSFHFCVIYYLLVITLSSEFAQVSKTSL